jgi:hypothetical protein
MLTARFSSSGHERLPTFWSAHGTCPRVCVHPSQMTRVQCRTLCLSARFHLSRQIHVVNQPLDRTLKISGRYAFHPERPANRPTSGSLSQAISSRVQVCPATQLPLPYVSSEPSWTPHQPQQIRLVRLLPAAQAGTNRRTHPTQRRATRLRLVPPTCGAARPSPHRAAPCSLPPSTCFSAIQQ